MRRFVHVTYRVWTNEGEPEIYDVRVPPPPHYLISLHLTHYFTHPRQYKGSNKLQGKAAILTGADSGIGRATALAFSREGAVVTIAYLPEEEDE
jgi:hypothetical protein